MGGCGTTEDALGGAGARRLFRPEVVELKDTVEPKITW